MQTPMTTDDKKPCFFCSAIKSSGQKLQIIPDLDLGSFVAVYDQYPVTPGHTLVIPKRHIQFMKDLRHDESIELLDAVAKTKAHLRSTDLRKVYTAMDQSPSLPSNSKAYIARCNKTLAKFNRPPDSFNDGVNDGPSAGQTVPHFHWHIMPRWQSDTDDPRGGVRHMFAGMGNYHLGIAGSLGKV